MQPRYTKHKAIKSYLRGLAGMRTNLAFVAAVRETVGPGIIDIILDCWKNQDVPYTIEMAHQMD